MRRRYPRIRDYPGEFVVRKTGVRWQICFVRRDRIAELHGDDYDDDDPTLGLTVDDHKTIYFCLGVSPKLRWRNFVHEIMHVAEYEHGLVIKHSTIYKIEAPVAELLADLGVILGPS